MTHDEYAALVTRLERTASANPKGYQLRVGALAVLGYGYVLAIMLVLLAAVALIAWGVVESQSTTILLVKLAIPLLALIAALGRALWVTVTPMQGRELTRGEAPVLFAEIDAVCRAARAPAPHHVRIYDAFNASVQQVPRLGIFGWHRNYLFVGLPLLGALTPEQFRAVLAHEFGHLSGAHARFGNWIYRVSGTWAQVEDAIQQRRSRLGALLVNRFVEWYEPYFRAYSFVLARWHEVEADRTAAAVAGSDVTALALTALALRGRYRNEVVWPRLTARIVDEPTPPRAGFSGHVQQLSAAMPPPMTVGWLTAALRVESDVDDPHPELADRLEAIGELPLDDAALAALAERVARPIDPAATAASCYLGPLESSIAIEIDDRWRGSASASWKDRHRHLVKAKNGLHELLERGEHTPLTPDEHFQVADWTEDLQGSDAAVPLLRTLVESEPHHASALFMLGRILLSHDDTSGIARLERSAEIDPKAAGPVSSLIAAHLLRVGRGQDAVQYRTRAESSYAENAAASVERRTIGPRDKVDAAAMDDESRTALHEQLARYPEVGRAWIARKVTRLAPDRPFLILGVARSEPWWRFVTEGSTTVLTRRLAEELPVPAGTLVIVLNRKRRWLRRALKKVKNSEVYRRDRGSGARRVTGAR